MDDIELDEDELAQVEAMRQEMLKRKREAAIRKAAAGNKQEEVVLAAASPSPAKKKRSTLLAELTLDGKSSSSKMGTGRRLFDKEGPARPSTSTSTSTHKIKPYGRPPPPRLAPKPETYDSELLEGLEDARRRAKSTETRRAHVKSTAFGTTATSAAAPTTTTTRTTTGSSVKGKGRANSDNQRYQDDQDGEEEEEEYKPIRPKRDNNLELVHELQPGPREFEPIPGDPDWLTIEPNSGIRLKSRALSHEALQEHLSDRFHLSPELLYSLVRPSKGGTEYELPIEGDWVVIGVLADKSEIRHTGGGGNFSGSGGGKDAAIAAKRKEAARKRKEREDRRKRIESGCPEPGDVILEQEEGMQSDTDLKEAYEQDPPDNQQQQEDPQSKTKSRRYISFKLIDLKNRNAGGGSGILNLKLFESDDGGSSTVRIGNSSSDDEYITSTGITVQKEVKSASTSRSWTAKAKRAQDFQDGIIDPSSSSTRRNYKGGSGGAYEKFWKAREGTLVAILNPRIMKPWSTNSNNNFTGNQANANVITLTPESAESMIVLGRAKDLGNCLAKKKDGKLCGAWCDTRVADACEWHVQQAVKSRRAGRAEFFAGTGGMKTTSLSHDDYQQMKRGFPAFSGGKAGSSASRAGSTSSSSFSRKLHDDSAYDPIARTGLLPTGAQTRGFDGLKTYVVGQGGGGTSSSLNLSRRLGMVGGRAFKAIVQPPGGGGSEVASRDSNSGLSVKEKQKKRAREEREMREMLRRDGGKSLGAKYLVRNGKAKISTTDTEAKKKRRKEDQSDDDEDSQEEDDGTAAEDSDTKETRKRKRVFNVKAVRKIGWDPSLIGDASFSNKAKPKADVLALLNNPINAAPKLDRVPGKKIRSGVSVPEHLKAADSLSTTVDDWDDLEDPEIAVRQARGGAAMTRNLDSGSFLFSSDEEDEEEINVGEGAHGKTGGGWKSEEDTSDLEIEPPVTVELE